MSAIDRRIDLDTGVMQGMPDFSQSSAGEGRREATDTDRHAFEQALARSPDDLQKDSPAVLPPALQPFGLLDPSSKPPAEPPSDLADSLGEAVDRLLVGDGQDGGRREVRMTLREDVMPGVTVAVYQDESRMVASFTCSNETSREKLVRCAAKLAEDISRSLSQAALVRVSTDDPEDPCLFEVVAAA